jgi:hypothetical protein
MNRLLSALLALGLTGLAHGQTVYSSGTPNGSTIWYGDASNPSATWAAGEFTLGSGASLNGVSWWGGFTTANAASPSDSFSMSLYSVGAGATVGSLIATVNLGNAGETATGSLIQAAPEYAYSASFASLALGSGTYFLALQRSGGPGTWGWESASGTGLEAYQNSAGAWFYNTGANVAFSLSGTLSPAPEPGTSLMLLAGLGGLALATRRARREPTRSAAG